MPKYEKNAQGRYDCPKPNCEHKGANGFEFPQGVGRHIWAKHKRHPKKAAAAAPTIKPSKTLARKSRVASSDELVAGNNHRVNVPMNDAPTIAAALANGTLTEMSHELNYCPCCGHDFAAIKDATGGVAPHKCPRCKKSLVAVSLGLTPAFQQFDPRRLVDVFQTMLNVVGRLS